MRPPRVIIIVLFLSASVFLIVRSVRSIRGSNTSGVPLTAHQPSFKALFSFSIPFSLFPPSAAITLTDDNSTFFPARPAAFGPPLPRNGLSGQLWVGSGFSDDSLQDGEGEGELGCSDIPGWEDGRSKVPIQEATIGTVNPDSNPDDHLSKSPDHLEDRYMLAGKEYSPNQKPHESGKINDGTDEYLNDEGRRQSNSLYNAPVTTHADIQSIQEAAEITGKIVLLSRGGCGFLEKVKWAQRRGAIALIVGDNRKGGPLIQMSARGNTDNVTIPSVFTSRMTARLLSSLTQPGSPMNDKGMPNSISNSDAHTKSKKDKPMRAKFMTADGLLAVPLALSSSQGMARPKIHHNGYSGWIPSRGLKRETQSAMADKSRPPSSGRLDWVLVDDSTGETSGIHEKRLSKTTDSDKNQIAVSESHSTLVDGLDDRRKGLHRGIIEDSGARNWMLKQPSKSPRTDLGSSDIDVSARLPTNPSTHQTTKQISGFPELDTLESRKLGSTESHYRLVSEIDRASSENSGILSIKTSRLDMHRWATTPLDSTEDLVREGLWVTITPTGSASPFFDTLLVLVISPLITLTIVYALLIIRVKIRMRRWRAPKSLVDRLPVRTYHAVPLSPGRSPCIPSQANLSPTTPLLQASECSSCTTVPEPVNLSRASDHLHASNQEPRGKQSGGKRSQWKKYMGLQVECVICLEEYIDGISKVMSLPCGHEFHAECM